MRAHGWIAALALLVVGCGEGPEAELPQPTPETGPSPITGTLTYRERIALSPEAQVEVRLLDVSVVDMPATTLGIARIEDPGLPPIDFWLEFNPANIDERNSYVVRAEIHEGDRQIFTTETAYPVLTRGAGNTVDLLLVAVDHSPTPPPPLFETHWKLISIDEQPVVTKAPPEDARLTLAAESGQAAGYTGCNRFSGSLEVDGDRLTLGPLASTRRACIDTMELETAFLAALARVDRYQIIEQELRLYAGPDIAASFVAVDPVVL
ncbi:MAG: YbaY family lipoprotein [Gammaproteobacteria bacterium]